jgi:hypothetical protein
MARQGDIRSNCTVGGGPGHSLSAPGGGVGRGVVGEGRRAAHLTLPVAAATGPLPLPPQTGGEGDFAGRINSHARRVLSRAARGETR